MFAVGGDDERKFLLELGRYSAPSDRADTFLPFCNYWDSVLISVFLVCGGACAFGVVIKMVVEVFWVRKSFVLWEAGNFSILLVARLRQGQPLE